MGTITINIDDETEKQFRMLVRKHKKGNLGKAETEALRLWMDEITQKQISEKELKILDKGFNMGKLKFKTREELYETKGW